ncbi:MAG: hypothetical protein QG670_250 [Thermoproteota archaeon]|nr:hypothetical protein [Thermoproteota archaeon]
MWFRWVESKSPHIVFNEKVELLLGSLYKSSRDREKRDALHNIIGDASGERAAFVNGDFYDALSFILLTFAVCDIVELNLLERRLNLQRRLEKLGNRTRLVITQSCEIFKNVRSKEHYSQYVYVLNH